VNKDLVSVIGEYRTKVVLHEEMWGEKKSQLHLTLMKFDTQASIIFFIWKPTLATTCGTSELLNALLKKVAKSNS
jgi:hypothetical protein